MEYRELLHNCGVIPVFLEYDGQLAELAAREGLTVTVSKGRMYYKGEELGELPEELPVKRWQDEELESAMKNPKVCAAADSTFLDLRGEEFICRCRKVRKLALGYGFAHMGLNSADEIKARETACFFEKAFGFPSFDIGASIIVAGPFEVVKSVSWGQNGHIGIETASIERGIADLEQKGFRMDDSTLKRAPDGRILSVYLEHQAAGFAIHLLQKR